VINGKWVAYVLIPIITVLQALFPHGGEAAKRETNESIVIETMLLAIVFAGNELLPRLRRQHDRNRPRSIGRPTRQTLPRKHAAIEDYLR
jgi:hypothetical protein